MARFMLHIMAAFAELEREMICERVKAGMKSAKHRGSKFGRPKAIFDRKRAKDMRATGCSVRAIAKALGVGSSTVQRLMFVS
jgi:DNA invertase Pin-like site-specific DNA recombinase